MTIKHLLFALLLAAILPLSAPLSTRAAVGDATFTTPGTYTYTVPAGVDEIYIKVWGAGGGGGIGDERCTGGIFGLFESCKSWPGVGGAGGGYAEVSIDVTPGEVFDVVVGAGGQGVADIYTKYSTYTANPTNTSSSAEASIVTSQLTGNYVGAGGGATGFTKVGYALSATPPDDYIVGSLSGKGAGQAVASTGAGLVGKIRSWCGDGAGNIESSCLTVPTGGNGFGTYSGITTLRGATPPMPIPFPNIPTFDTPGGAGANGGAGGTFGQPGAAPGGGAGSGTTPLRGGAGRVIILVGESVGSGNFDFNLSNNGDAITTPGGSITNLITGTITQGTARPTNLTVSSITNSSNASVLNTSNGFTVTNAAFSNSSITPTQSSTLRIDATATIPAGVYTVTVSADTPSQTSTTVTTSGSGTIYYCKSEGVHFSAGSQFDGETFACSTTQTFSVDQARNDAVTGDSQFINNDSISGSGSYPYRSSTVYKDWLVGTRTSLANYYCGTGKWTLYPYGSSSYNPSTGYICTGSSSNTTTNTEPAVHKTTTFTITVDSYNLIAEKGADVCSAGDAYTRLTWKRDPAASSYRLYKRQGAGTETYVSVPQPSSGTTVTYYDPDSNFSNSTGLTVGDLYTYRVASNVGGVIQGSSPTASAFPSSVLPSASCTMTYTVGGGDVTIQQGGSLSVNVPLTLTSGATQSVSVQFTPAVSGITFAPSMPSCSSISCSTTTIISVAQSVPVGTYTYTVSARSSGNITATNTLIVRVTGNARPYPVKTLSIIGPCSGDGIVNQSSVVSFTTETQADPDGDAVTYEYQIDYGSGYGTAVSNGTAKYLSLTWTSAGAIKIRVRAVDSKGATSPWVEQGLTIRSTCGTNQTLVTECVSGFNAITNEATWFASTSGGTGPYTYSWNNSAFTGISSSKTVISTPGGTAAGPTLVAMDSKLSKASAFPTCSTLTRDTTPTAAYSITGETITMKIGQTAPATFKVKSDNGVSESITLVLGSIVNRSSGSSVGYMSYSPNTQFTCTSIVSECSKQINVTVNAVTGRTGTFDIEISGTSTSGRTASGIITIIVTDKPVIWSGISFTTSNGIPTCNQSSIIASWNADPNPAVTGYNLYRWQGSGVKVLMNTNGPIAQKPSGTITYEDTRVAAGESYTYEVREINNGVESIASTYSIRTAPTPTTAQCPAGFGFSVTGDNFIVLPGQTIKANARLRLVLGASKPVKVSINQIISSAPINQPKTLADRITSAVSMFFGIARAAEPYITVGFTGSSTCASLPCDVPLTINVSPSASENEYLVPLVAYTSDNTSMALGYIQVVVSNIPPTPQNTSSVVTLSNGMADCINSSIVVSWTKDLNSSGYYLYRSQANQSFPVRVNTTAFTQPTGASRSYTDSNLIPGVTYTYYVTSIINNVESNKSNSVTRTAPTVPMGPGSCPFSMQVTGDGVSLKPGEEKVTRAHILLNIGSNTATTLKIGAAAVGLYVSQDSTKSKISITKTLKELFALGPIKLNAAGTVTASFLTNGHCISLPCDIDIKITSASNTAPGTYTFPLTATTDGPIPGIGIVSAGGSLPVQIQSGSGCAPNCINGAEFKLGINATPVTVVAGQSTSSLVSVFTISPAGVDKSSTGTLGATRYATGDNQTAVTSITSTPNEFICNHSVPTCVQNISINTSIDTATGSYVIPITARTGSGETATMNIAVTVTPPSNDPDAEPDLQARAFYPSGSATPVIDWRKEVTITPRRSAYLAPVVVDVEFRKVFNSTVDFSSCYTIADNGTANWIQGTETSPVSPALVLVKKTLTIVGTDKLTVKCLVGSTKTYKTATVNVVPINDPVIKEF